VLKNSIGGLGGLSPHLQVIRFENRKLFAAWNSPQYVNAAFIDDNVFSFTPIRLQEITPIPFFVDHTLYSADIAGNKIQLAYEAVKDPRYGFDIYANTQLLPQVDFSYVPPTFELVSAVYPNPTSGAVTIQYQIAAPKYVAISVYNIIGQKVLDVETGTKGAGIHDVRFDTRGLPSGVYFLRYTGVRSYGQKVLVIK
jgi:hypothetical protein